jgi:hypothetical protein
MTQMHEERSTGRGHEERSAGRGDEARAVRGSVEPRTLDLDALAAMDVEALGALYAKGTTPPSVEALAGHPRGRMLAVRTLDGRRRGRAIAGLARAGWFPWGGKSFFGAGTSGRGVNRVHLGRSVGGAAPGGGRHELFPFHTSIRASVLDGAPCVALDYDLPDNPSFIRAIHDEVREVAPGLFLGPAMWKTKSSPAFVLWFALDTRVQARPIGDK